MADVPEHDLTALTVDLLGAFLSSNNVRPEQLPELIQATHAALAGLSTAAEAEEPVQEYTPAVTARKSLGNPDHILSMIDGKPYKSLKRHLSANGLTPEEYRSRYNLPANYPMVASGYSEKRREVAKRLGLGRKPRAQTSEQAPAAPEPTVPAEKPARKPRAKKESVSENV